MPGSRIGRADALLRDAARGEVVPNNTHFDTTRANFEVGGAHAVDLRCVESKDQTSDAPFAPESLRHFSARFERV